MIYAIHILLGLKALFLEGNVIESIENLENQKQLNTLHLQRNVISKISGLDHCTQLTCLDLSGNSITKIENLAHLKSLSRLILSYNCLSDAKSIEHVVLLPQLSVLDLQHNKIEGRDDYEDILRIFKGCPELRVLYLKGNGVTKHIPH